MEVVEQLLYLRLTVCYLCQYVAVYIFECTARRYFAIEIFTRQYQRPIDEIAVYSHEFAIVADLEVSPRKVVVFCLGCIGCKHITQHVLFVGHIDEIFVQPHSPVA